MALRYKMADAIRGRLSLPCSFDGQVVVTLDAHGVARFERIQDAQQTLENGEKLLAFRSRGRQVRLASDAYFFQEGQAKRFSTARYGELRVGGDGDAVLVGLRDANYRSL